MAHYPINNVIIPRTITMGFIVIVGVEILQKMFIYIYFDTTGISSGHLGQNRIVVPDLDISFDLFMRYCFYQEDLWPYPPGQLFDAGSPHTPRDRPH